MDHAYWLKQLDEPLFPEILWSRPESKQTSGKLAIIGGNSHGFSAPGQLYSESLDAGSGVSRVLLPDAVKKIVHGIFPDADFAPSTPSGSFSKKALDDLLSISNWADMTVLCGDVGRNSETAVLLENFVQKSSSPICVVQDVVDYFVETPLQLVDRPNTTLVVTLAQLQKMFIYTPTITPITSSMTVFQLVEALHSYTLEHKACIIVKHNDTIFVADSGRLSTTKHNDKFWRMRTTARSSVFWMQNPTKVFESTTTALHNLDSAKN